MENDTGARGNQITQVKIDRTVIALAAREMSLEEIVRKYKLMVRGILKKTAVEPDLVRDDKDRIN